MRCINFQMIVRKVRGMKKQFTTLRERIIIKISKETPPVDIIRL